MQGSAMVKIKFKYKNEKESWLGFWQPWACFLSEAWLQDEKDILKYEVHRSPPLRMAQECADSLVFLVAFPDCVAEQTRCPESGRKTLCKCKSKSQLIGKTWFANHNSSEWEQIWETPEYHSQVQPVLLSQLTLRSGKPARCLRLRTEPSTLSKCFLLCIWIGLMQRHGQVCPLLHFCEKPGQAVTPWSSAVFLSVKWEMNSLAVSLGC